MSATRATERFVVDVLMILATSKQFSLIWLLHLLLVFLGLWTLVLVSWEASCSSLVMKQNFYKLTIHKVHPPIVGLHHMQQCEVGWNIPLYLFDPNEWCVKNWPPQWGVWTLSHESSALTTATPHYFLLVCLMKTFHFPLITMPF